MLACEDARAKAVDLIALAKTAGADAADCVYAGSSSTDVQVRLGVLEDVQQSEGESMGLRVFIGSRSASASSSDLSTAALTTLAERVVAMAKLAPEDPFAGLAPEDRLVSGPLPDLDLDDGEQPLPAVLKARALECEDAARSIEGVTNSYGGSGSAGRASIALATSTGFSGSYSGSSHSCSVSVIAGDGNGMQVDSHWSSARHMADLEDAAGVGLEAGRRAVAKLNPVKLKSGAMPVIFDPRVGPGLLGHLIGAITGSAIARKTSFLLDNLGTQIFSKGINIIDNPLRFRGMASKPFDGEGLPTALTQVIKDGVLTGWLMDSASARQLGLAPTGHAQRGVSGAPGASTTNLHMEAGSLSPADLMADIKLGIYVTSLIGQGVNGLTGDYSRGASGFVIRDGVLAEPVQEVTIAGNLKSIFAELTPADDLEFRYGTNTPTVRIEGMMLAGD